jgi:hypothetical protein
MTESSDSALSAALDQFDRVEANLVKLEHVWAEIAASTPTGVAFGFDDGVRRGLVRAFGQLAQGLPAIDGYRVDATPMGSDEVAQLRFDALEVDEIGMRMSVEDAIDEPARQLEEYRLRLEESRRRLVRGHVLEATAAIDQILRDVASDGSGTWTADDRWFELNEQVAVLARLVGNLVPRRARWNDLRRHLSFAQPVDLNDIVNHDWPSVRDQIETALYDDREPLPVDVVDLGDLVRARPTGPVSTRLDWSVLSADQFEALVFDLIRLADGYENVNWLMRTNAADRGRDVEAQRVVIDALSGTRRTRVIVQCKHWTTRSVNRSDLIECRETMRLWEPPAVGTLIIATTGRFTQDAVEIAQRWSEDGERPSVELWPESHLEALLASRPSVAAGHGLR